MNSLIGTYECKADAKGRLVLPSALKKQLTTVLQDGFVLKRSVFQPCIEVYPMAEWQVEMENLKRTVSRFKKQHNDFVRRFTAGVKIVEVDANGRLLIPKDLIEFAGISKELVLTSTIDVVEIWDKTKYEDAIDLPIEELADLAEEIMSQDKQYDGIS